MKDNHNQLPATRYTSEYFPLTFVGVTIAIILSGIVIVVLAQLLLFPASTDNNLTAILTDERIVRVTGFTLYQAALSTVLSLGLGIVLAWSLANQRRFWFRKILISLISAALVLPTLVVVLGVVGVYGRSGWLAGVWAALFGQPLPFSIYGMSGILLAHVFFNASFAASLLLHRFQTIPEQRHKLGYSLGLGFIRKLMIIDLPAIRPALPSLAVTIFLLCFTSFSIVLTLGGSPAYNTLEVSIYEAIKFDFDLQRAFSLALVQIGVCIVLVLLAASWHSTVLPSGQIKPNSNLHHLIPNHIKLLQYCIIILFAMFFLTPLLSILRDGVFLGFGDVLAEPAFQQALFTSVLIAVITTFVTLFISVALSSALVTLAMPQRWPVSTVSHLLRRAISVSSMLYLVFPALVLGLGFFLLFQRVGGNAQAWAYFVVIFSNTVMAIPFGVAIFHPAIAAVATNNDRLCMSLGMGFWQRLKRVNIPLLKGELAYAGALAFCFSLGDLGVISLFGSENFKTLPWLLYQKFGSYRTNDASAIALVMLVLVAVVFFVSQLASRTKDVRQMP